MLISHADAKQLTVRKRALHDLAALADSEALREACIRVGIKMMSDEVATHRVCPSRACKRHHRCVGEPFRCGKLIRARGSKRDPLRIVEGIYWMTLQSLVDNGEIDG